jgi:acetyl esterase/lipase
MPSEDRRILDRPAPPPAETWAYGPARGQIADVYLPPAMVSNAATLPAAQVVLLVHGGFWRPEYDRLHLRPMAAALAAAGHPTVLAEYARVPGEPDAALDDLCCALEALAGALDTTPGVLVVGHSAGGHLALLLSGRAPAPIAGTLALAPVADLAMAERLALDDGATVSYLGAPASSRPDLDPVRGPEPLGPVTVVHGAADTLVPVELSASYCRAHAARLVTVAGCGHFELIDPASGHWPVVLAELSALVPPSGIE